MYLQGNIAKSFIVQSTVIYKGSEYTDNIWWYPEPLLLCDSLPDLVTKLLFVPVSAAIKLQKTVSPTKAFLYWAVLWDMYLKNKSNCEDNTISNTVNLSNKKCQTYIEVIGIKSI